VLYYPFGANILIWFSFRQGKNTLFLSVIPLIFKAKRCLGRFTPLHKKATLKLKSCFGVEKI